MHRPVIDENGKFIRFIGLSVVSHLIDRDASRWSSLYEYVCSLKNFCNYYTPLPPTSYHVTIRDVFDAYKGEQNFIESVMERFSQLEKIRTMCLQSQVRPILRVVNAYFGSTFGLTVRFENETDLRKVQTLRTTIAKTLGVQDKAGNYHITLGYMYRSGIETCPEADREQKRLYDKLTQYFAVNSIIPCDTAVLVYFKNMTVFTPI